MSSDPKLPTTRRQALGLLLAAPVLQRLAFAQGAASPGVLRTGHAGEPDSIDPHMAIAAPSIVVINDLFEGLTTLDASEPGSSNRGHSFEGTETDFTKLPPGVIGRALTESPEPEKTLEQMGLLSAGTA